MNVKSTNFIVQIPSCKANTVSPGHYAVFVAAEIYFYFYIKLLRSCLSVFRAHGPPDTKQEC